MAQVFGQIESLKQLRAILNAKGISRFTSLSDINDFLDNYEFEKQEILDQAEQAFDLELAQLKSDSIKFQKQYKNLTAESITKLNAQISRIQAKIELIEAKGKSNWLRELYDAMQLKRIKTEKKRLEDNFYLIINERTAGAEKKIARTNKQIAEYKLNREQLLEKRCSPDYRKLAYIREAVEELRPLIAGAKGEHLVVKEVEKLSDDHILINDFSLSFDPPIYNRKENDRIFSVQIDHLLLTKAGIFLLETKNWSRRSIERLDMRSPIKQIQRTSYALFTLLNSESNRSANGLNWHHWGTKQIPIRNVVVMINEKPREKFNFVAVKSLNELNGYINYFNPVFSDEEFRRVADRLMTMNR